MDAPNLLPSLSLLLLLLLLPPLSLFVHKLLRKQAKKPSLHLPPGPPKLPIIGNLHQLGNLPHHSLWRLSQHYGPLMFLLLGHTPAIVVSSADMARQVLRTHDLHCCSRPSLFSLNKLSYGGSDIGFAPFGDQWRELRKMFITKIFSPRRNLLLQSIMEEEIGSMMRSISSHAKSTACRNPVDLSDMLLSLSNNIICRAALGKSYQGVGVFEWSRIERMVKEAQALLSAFFVADYIPRLGWIDKLMGMQDRLEKNFHELDQLYQQVIDDHSTFRRSDDERDQEDIVDTLLRVQKEDECLTQDHIKGVLMNTLLAGTDAPTSGVEWAMTELVRNPKAMKRAQEEIRNVIGSKGKVEEGDLHKLSYLEAVVKETMRLHPPTPLLLPRETSQHLKINGYDIPAKTRVMVNAWAIGREESCWQKPEEFNPERFLESSVDMRGQDFQLIPFGSGRRICPAMHFGVMTVELVLANLVYGFDWDLFHGNQCIDLDEKPGVTIHRKSPLCLVAIQHGGMEMEV